MHAHAYDVMPPLWREKVLKMMLKISCSVKRRYIGQYGYKVWELHGTRQVIGPNISKC